jgi:Rps23 Pro-64 3,4-dihydroxylase Tpa1-like proline 4-hydroxylase
LVGYELLLDTTKNFWGVHKYYSGDKLDIHVDAGDHPILDLKKQVTIGICIYLSHNWKIDSGCELEIWNGTSCAIKKPQLYNKVASISPLFNRFIIFTCNDFAWHGNPTHVKSNSDSKRIFITLSYLSKNKNDNNNRKKAFFIETPDLPFDLEKQKLRDLRANISTYKDIYRI